jgi:MoxR-like ATPase
MFNRYAPSIDDVNAVAIPVLRHRMVTSFNAEAEGITVVDLIDKLLKEQS